MIDLIRAPQNLTEFLGPWHIYFPSRQFAINRGTTKVLFSPQNIHVLIVCPNFLVVARVVGSGERFYENDISSKV